MELNDHDTMKEVLKQCSKPVLSFGHAQGDSATDDHAAHSAQRRRSRQAVVSTTFDISRL